MRDTSEFDMSQQTAVPMDEAALKLYQLWSIKVPEQSSDGMDCGRLVCVMMRLLVEGYELNDQAFKIADMEMFRRRLCHEMYHEEVISLA